MNESKSEKVLTTGVLKKTSEKAILDWRKDIVLSKCPKCGFNTYAKEQDVCVNCDEE